MKYFIKDILKPFKVKIIRYAESVCEMHDLEKYLPPLLVKEGSAMSDKQNIRNE